MRKTFLMLCVGLAILVASLPVSSARTSGNVRAASDIDTIVIHSIGGPACQRNSVVFQPIRAREDDADFWKDFLLHEPEADAHFVIGRSGKVAEIRSDGVQTSPLALPEVLTGPAREQACAKID